CQQYNNRISF
nr:immunoglobulin light chain junction region [Macaca mulatta]